MITSMPDSCLFFESCFTQ